MKTVQRGVLEIRGRGVGTGEFKMWSLTLRGMEGVVRGDVS